MQHWVVKGRAGPRSGRDPDYERFSAMGGIGLRADGLNSGYERTRVMGGVRLCADQRGERTV